MHRRRKSVSYTHLKDQKGFLESIAGFFGGDEELVTETSEEEISLYSSNKDKDKGNNGNDKNNGKGNGNGNSLMELNINGIMDTAYSYGNERLTNERFTERTGYYTYDSRGSVTGVTDSKGISGSRTGIMRMATLRLGSRSITMCTAIMRRVIIRIWRASTCGRDITTCRTETS